MTERAPVERLRGPNLLLRDLTVDDVDAIHRIVGDSRVTDWLSIDPRSHAQTLSMLEDAQKRRSLTPRTEYYMGMQAPEGALVGFLRLATNGATSAKVGYAVQYESWGRGYATEAVRVAVTFGFTELDLHRITAAVGPENHASLSVLRRLGFVYEGRLREHVFTNGAWRDSLLYSVLNHEWPGP